MVFSAMEKHFTWSHLGSNFPYLFCEYFLGFFSGFLFFFFFFFFDSHRFQGSYANRHTEVLVGNLSSDDDGCQLLLWVWFFVFLFFFFTVS